LNAWRVAKKMRTLVSKLLLLNGGFNPALSESVSF